ncbi:hypothetical protein CONPUDRAFT_67658 [Coniophora puteana RWD-64-598 SS2]|uniref:T6SS Phospholipase effector Tle1-like catalytic domain-containing protein n=1 Tax=Coniophora puteana (strain RWD-64-598) TaxID=741705 RepID=R7SDR1_CONPW|nr:uncharacterized protein CONPUDRAFT_67658 [Coniophora puteana RWD-64-598 SS2]EIW74303.1 hypothetical protein CONPUDRAFT_67658 [Coniophora puteana RWD-64-598 SS2]
MSVFRTASDESPEGDKRQYATNILRLSRSVKPVADSGREQIVFYQSGVGSQSNFNGAGGAGVIDEMALGTFVASKIRDVYAFIAQNYRDGDIICIFGYVKGAYTARKVAGLIDRIGLLETRDLGHFFKIWKQLYDGVEPQLTGRNVDIDCVGVFDTVGSVWKEIDALNIADNSLPKSIKTALHAVSFHENRDRFLPTLWIPPKEGLGEGQVLKEVWFPGAHADVGGGYERHELSDITLFWMAGEIQTLGVPLGLDYDFLKSLRQPVPDAGWGASQPHNAWNEMDWKMKLVIHAKDRLKGEVLTDKAVFHESMLVSPGPNELNDPKSMITLNDLDWTPKTLPLNKFEKKCKDSWKLRVGSIRPSSAASTKLTHVTSECAVGPPGIRDPRGVVRLIKRVALLEVDPSLQFKLLYMWFSCAGQQRSTFKGRWVE